MRKSITRLTALVAVALVLVACGGGGSTGPSNVGLTTEENGRKYHGFALASSFTNAPSFEQYHSRYIQPWGQGTSNNTVRYATAETDAIIDFMQYADPSTDALEYKENYLAFVKTWNEELPQLPMYANQYHDLYNGNNLQNFVTGPLFQWRESIVEATSPNDTVTIGVSSSFNGDFIVGWTNSAYDEDVRTLVFGSGLLVGDEGGKLTKNYMTDTFEISEDQKTWTFKLKEGLKWSDGEAFTADDIMHTYLLYAHPDMVTAGAAVSRADLATTYVGWEEFEAAMMADGYDPEAKDDEGNPLAGAWDMTKLDAALANFDGFKKLDDLTVQFNFKEVEFNTWSSFEARDILPEHYYSPNGIDPVTVRNTLMAKPLGSGPYTMDEYLEGQYIKLSVNEFYPGNINGIKPRIPNLVYKVTADETDVDELLAGQVDLLAGQISGVKIDPVKAAADKGWAFNEYKRHGYGHLSFHTDFGPMAFKEVRQAFAFGIDREEFIEEFTGGYAVTVQGPYSLAFVMDDAEYDAATPWHIAQSWVDENLIDYKYDPAKANEVMKDAGWEKGKDGLYAKEVDGETIQAVIGLGAGSQDWADALNLSTRNMEKEIGIKVIIEPIDFSILLDHYYGSFKN